MDAPERKAFKSAVFGGFDKDDVNSYIIDVTETYEARLKAADEEKIKLSSALRTAEEELSALRKENAALKARCDELSDATERLALAENENLDANRSLEGLREELSALRDRETELSKVSSEYNERKAQLADVELTARKRAEEIIAEAERKAAERNAALELELSAKRREAEEWKKGLVDDAKALFSRVSGEYASLRSEIDTLDLRISRITDSVRAGVSSFTLACREAEDKLSNIKDELPGEE